MVGYEDQRRQKVLNGAISWDKDEGSWLTKKHDWARLLTNLGFEDGQSYLSDSRDISSWFMKKVDWQRKLLDGESWLTLNKLIDKERRLMKKVDWQIATTLQLTPCLLKWWKKLIV